MINKHIIYLLLTLFISSCSSNRPPDVEPTPSTYSIWHMISELKLESVYVDNDWGIIADSANGSPTEGKRYYNYFLKNITPNDTIATILSRLGPPNYIRSVENDGDGYVELELAFTSDMNIYSLAAIWSKTQGYWKLTSVTPITYQIPEISGQRPTIINNKSKDFVKSDRPAKTIAVMDFSGAGISTGEAQALSERLRLELFNVGSFKLLERGMMEQVLQEQGFQQTGCVDSECMVEVGNLIGVELMVGGSISKVGTVHSVSAKIFSVSTGEIVKTAQLDFRGDIGDLMLGGMKKIAQDLSNY